MAVEAWTRTARGVFLEIRLIPVLLWSYTAVALGTGLAFMDTGRLDAAWFGVALALGLLIQGYTTHSVNEIYDWRSGTDRHVSARALSGGSKVLNMGLLDERALWAIFWIASGAVAVLAALVGIARAPWLVLVIGLGYGVGVAYTVPPLATSYRPFAGEWLGGFPGVLLAGVGAYGIQTLSLTWTAVVALSAHACVCTSMLVMHGYLDAAADAHEPPGVLRQQFAVHRNRHTFNSGLLPFSDIQNLCFKATRFRPAQVHTLEHGSPILRVGSARARVDGKDGRVVVVPAGKHGSEGSFFEFGFDGQNFCFQFSAQTRIIKLGELERVVQPARKAAPRIHFGFYAVILFHYLLCLRRIAPEFRRFYFFFKPGEFEFL